MVSRITTFLATLLASCLIACSQDSRTAPATRAETRPTATTRPALTEEAKIERLLQTIADDKGAKFIRNNSEHDGKAAADHLRSKWRSAGSKIKTAKSFIENIASSSSMSGKSYEVKLADGTKVKLRDWLTERLAAIEKGP
jgi:hypothetical protein